MKFIYKGPLSGITINKVETLLYKGKEVDLPEDNSHIKTLIALGYLVKEENNSGNNTENNQENSNNQENNTQSPEVKEGENEH